MSTRAEPALWARQLGAGWFLDWSTRSWNNNAQVDYWQMVRISKNEVRPAIETIRALARKHPGMVWVIGNEPDNSLQDNLRPEEYADFYHQIYTVLKTADPTVKVAMGGVTQATPLRFEYLERVLENYETKFDETMPVDWWTIHAYVLREERDSWGAGIPTGLNEESGLLIDPADHGDMELFARQMIAFRIWMKAQGYQSTPLAITEFGILLPESLGYSPESVAQYLGDTFDWLVAASDPLFGCPTDEYRLVQRWAWFSLADPIFPVADLANLDSGQLTRTGEAFRNFTLEHRGN